MRLTTVSSVESIYTKSPSQSQHTYPYLQSRILHNGVNISQGIAAHWMVMCTYWLFVLSHKHKQYNPKLIKHCTLFEHGTNTPKKLCYCRWPSHSSPTVCHTCSHTLHQQKPLYSESLSVSGVVWWRNHTYYTKDGLWNLLEGRLGELCLCGLIELCLSATGKR